MKTRDACEGAFSNSEDTKHLYALHGRIQITRDRYGVTVTCRRKNVVQSEMNVMFFSLCRTVGISVAGTNDPAGEDRNEREIVAVSIWLAAFRLKTRS